MTTKIALVGYGAMGKIHAKHLTDLQEAGKLQFVGIADPLFEENQPQGLTVPFFSRYDDLISQMRPDGVIVATPTQTHFELVQEILPHCHVLVEKPIATTASEAEKLAEMAEQSPYMLFVGHAERFNPAMTHAIQLIESGRIGKIVSISTKRHNPFPVGRSTMGDVLLDLGSHDVDLVQLILDRQGLSLETANIQCVGVSSPRTPTEFLDHVIMFAQLDGIAVTVSTSWVDSERLRMIEIIGTGGKLDIDLAGREVIELPNTGGYDPSDQAAMMRFVGYGRRRIDPIPQVDKWPVELQDYAFVSAIEGELTMLATPHDGVVVVDSIEKALKSHRENF